MIDILALKYTRVAWIFKIMGDPLTLITLMAIANTGLRIGGNEIVIGR